MFTLQYNLAIFENYISPGPQNKKDDKTKKGQHKTKKKGQRIESLTCLPQNKKKLCLAFVLKAITHKVT